MTTRQSATVVLLAVLSLVFYLYAKPEYRANRHECEDSLQAFSTHLLSWAQKNGNRFPTAFHELGADYQSKLPTCPEVSHLPCYPRYEVSPDRANFAIWCPNLHRGDWATYSAVVGDRNYQNSMTDMTRGSLADCEKQLRAEALFLREQSEDELRGPYPLYGYDGFSCYACRGTHEVCFRNDGSYEIICCSALHMAEGLRPLQPRYDSRTKRIVGKVFEPFDRPPARPIILNPKFHLGVLIFVLMLIAIRHAFFRKPKAQVRENRLALAPRADQM